MTLYILLPLLAALTGWIAVKSAVTLFFRPLRPCRVAGITIQGYLPRRLPFFIVSLSKSVSKEFSLSVIEAKVSDPENFQKILPEVEAHIDHFLKVKLAEKMPMVSMFIGENTTRQLKAVFMEELSTLFPLLMQQYMKQLSSNIDPEQLISSRLSAYSPEKVEKLLRTGLKRELRTLEYVGALIGLVIGLIQLLLMYLLA